jgi:hypothetical protein
LPCPLSRHIGGGGIGILSSALRRAVQQLEAALFEAQRRTPDAPQDRTDAGDHTLNTNDAA